MAATYIVVTNASENTLSLEGDDRNPAVSIPRSGTANINIVDVLGNQLLCDMLSDMVTASTVTITRGGTTVTAAQLTAYKQGADMDRVDYDTDDDNVVDKAEAIDATSRTAVTVAMSPYTVLATDTIIQTASTTNVIGLTLPAGVDGKTYTIIDGSGSAGTNAVTITPDGAETIEGAANLRLLHNFDSVTLYYDATTTDWKVIHRVDHSEVRGSAAIDMVALGNNAVALNGGASRAFLLKEAIFVCTAGAALNGDVTVSLGTTAGGAEIMGATQLTGLDAAGETFRIAMTGEVVAIAGNDALDCTVTIADTGGGATGTMTCYLIGEEV
jgi:hypothetical protein